MPNFLYSWRKDLYSSEIDSWFENVDIAPVIQNEAYSLQAASKSGLLPINGIEEHPRTVKNIVYQSESESEQSSIFDSNIDITVNTEPTPQRFNSSTPVHQNTTLSLSPYDRHPLSPLPWNHNFMRPRMMSDSVLPHVAPVPPKNIAQSSIPCVWSYSTQPSCGIAPHYSSNFFYRLRQRKQSTKKSGGNKIGTKAYLSQHHFPPSRLFYHSLPQSHEQMVKRKESKMEEFGRRHSLYDQFVLHRDPKLDRKIPTRRAMNKLQSLLLSIH